MPAMPAAARPLHYAADSNPVGEVARALFEAGADPEACDGYDQKPLDYAISSANDAFIEAALDAGADPRPAAAMPSTRRETRRATPVLPSGKTRAYRRLMTAGSRLRPRNKPGAGFHED